MYAFMLHIAYVELCIYIFMNVCYPECEYVFARAWRVIFFRFVLMLTVSIADKNDKSPMARTPARNQ